MQFDGTLAEWTGIKFNYPIIVLILTLFHLVKRSHLSIEKIDKFNRADITNKKSRISLDIIFESCTYFLSVFNKQKKKTYIISLSYPSLQEISIEREFL